MHPGSVDCQPHDCIPALGGHHTEHGGHGVPVDEHNYDPTPLKHATDLPELVRFRRLPLGKALHHLAQRRPPILHLLLPAAATELLPCFSCSSLSILIATFIALKAICKLTRAQPLLHLNSHSKFSFQIINNQCQLQDVK